ncbi:MAG: hypothetical protein OK442_05155 [Thaumarchaeota archaeon]|nr:hypothetical protein [Nitrososphaerota archaeon]
MTEQEDNIKSLLAELAKVEAQITQNEEEIRSSSNEGKRSDYLNEKWYLDIKQRQEPFYQRSRYLHEVYTTYLLRSVGDSTERLAETTSKLESGVQALKQSSDAQLEKTKELVPIATAQSETTKKLQSSSRRLEFLTTFLLLLTCLTLTDTFIGYFTPAAQIPAARALLSFVFLAILLVLIVYWVMNLRED